MKQKNKAFGLLAVCAFTLTSLTSLTSCDLIDSLFPNNSSTSTSTSSSSSTVTEPEKTDFQISVDATEFKVGQSVKLSLTTNVNFETEIIFNFNESYVNISSNKLNFSSPVTISSKREGSVSLYAKEVGSSKRSNNINLKISGFVSDPYRNVDPDEFHDPSTYYMATSLQDALYRSENGILSGELTVPDQEPTVSKNMPTKKVNGKDQFVKNSNVEANLNASKDTYNIVDYKGDYVRTIYKGGAYVSLEDVAAYVTVFRDIPANYTENKSDKNPSNSIFGKYYRLNHSYFNGDTSRYPYEPVLPEISGVDNGPIKYYELDIGTIYGTDCDPKYDAEPYNNGKTIVRGAARIVYGRFLTSNDSEFYDFSRIHTFYTYNHYNDFQEYLNYENGWGEMFGNVTGGGTLSSKTDYNPTPYVPVVYSPLK